MSVTTIHDGLATGPAVAGYARASQGRPVGGTRPEDWAPFPGALPESGDLEMPLGGYLLRTGDRVVLVDLGLGDRVNPPSIFDFQGGGLLDDLARVGVAVEAVTDVVFTHLHYDHMGWASTNGEPTFPHATYWCDELDWAHFVPSTGAAPDAWIAQRLAPIATRLQLWSQDGEILPGLRVWRAPGHTPGSTIVVFSAGESTYYFIGDLAHHPLQLLDPGWGSLGDLDPARARRSRADLVARVLATPGAIVAACHFPGSRTGQLTRGDDSLVWTDDHGLRFERLKGRS